MIAVASTFRWRLSTRFISVLVVVFAEMISACSADQPQRLPVDADKLIVVGKNGQQKAAFEIEVASTVEQRSTGLMHRTDLPRDRGMLFVFEGERERAFWMKDTPASLDIIYIDEEGSVVSIARATVPFSTQPIPSLGDAQFVLEVLSGVASEIGLVAGDAIVHPRIGNATP
ncbi:MAG: DUF192 domain-containing protein [Pseudomonadota bacterium]